MGKRSNFSRSNYRGKTQKKSRDKANQKELTHWKEFGERHPIEDEEFQKFEATASSSTFPKAKRVKLSENSKINNSLSKDDKEKSDTSSSSDAESESEVEAQPYNQLLSMLKGTSRSTSGAISDESDDEDLGEEEEEDEIEEEEVNNDGSEKEDQGTELETSTNWELQEAADDDDSVTGDDLEDDSDTDQAVSRDLTFQHFDKDLPDNVVTALTSSQPYRTEKMRAPVLGDLVIYLPNVKQVACNKPKVTLNLTDKQDYAQPGGLPDLGKQPKIKTQLVTNVPPLSPFQKELLTILGEYKDLYYPERTLQNQDEIQRVYCLHALNHVLKTRNHVLQHNAKLKKAAEQGRNEEYRDQGLVRPRVLMVLPLRSTALKIVHMLASILLPAERGQIMNKKRFDDEYGAGESQNKEKKKHYKPQDFEDLFQGNIDDSFRIGISVSKRSIRLYTGFYNSDILIASPLGLRTLLADDFDFLSSIEVLILDQTDVLLMQNWDHVVHLFDHLHLQPREQHGTDLSRVRYWALNGWAPHYRQTLFFSSTPLPEAVALFLRRGTNFSGKVRVENAVPQNAAAICRVVAQLPQAFRRFESPTAAKAAENRFDFFVKKVLPQYRDSLMNGTLIFVPSYFDYVRLRNYFHKQELNFAQACEYTPDGKLAQARNRFFTGKKRMLLYTERLHFYRRLTIKGIRHIIFYQLPTYSHFYSELCNLVQDIYQPQKNRKDGSSFTCTVLYCSFDAPRLTGVVGTHRAAQMITSERSVHMFVSGET